MRLDCDFEVVEYDIEHNGVLVRVSGCNFEELVYNAVRLKRDINKVDVVISNDKRAIYFVLVRMTRVGDYVYMWGKDFDAMIEGDDNG